MKPKMSISFSGGRSSAVMTKLLVDSLSGTHDLAVTFANTGCEHPDTLRFINDCDKAWGLNTVWLEAVVTHGERVGIRHKIVTYETASQKGEPFKEVIKKYGIPSNASPQCTSRLKTEVMESYLKSIGFVRRPEINYETAIGIRADEVDRISKHRKRERLVYPLISQGWTKQKIQDFMSQFPFDLKIAEHYGNCVWCYKKSFRKLYTIAVENPSAFDFPRQMEKEFSKHKATNDDRFFFRGNKSAEDVLFESMVEDYEPFDAPGEKSWSTKLDQQGSCSEVCDVYDDLH